MRVALRRHTIGVTLVELIVIVVIVATLASLLLPAVQQTRELTRRTSCQNNLRQMGVALHGFQTVYGSFPPGSKAAVGLSTGGCDPEEVAVEDNPGKCTDYQAWTAECLPYFEATPLADLYDYGQPWSSLRNRDAISTHMRLFACPSAPTHERVDRHHVVGAMSTDYAAITQVDRGVYTDLLGVPDPGIAARDGVLAEYKSCSPGAIRDGLSNTLMVVECAGRAGSFVLGRPMSAAQFAAYTQDEIIEVAGTYLVDEGIGWADPDSGISIEGTGNDGVEIYGPRMVNATNVGEAYSFHRGGANSLASDGSTRFLSEQIDVWAYIGLCTRSGGEVNP